MVELRIGGKPAIAAKALGAVARHGGYYIGGMVYTADDIVAAIGKKYVPFTVCNNTCREIQFCICGSTPIAKIIKYCIRTGKLCNNTKRRPSSKGKNYRRSRYHFSPP